MRKALVLPLIPLALALSAGWAIAAAPDAKGPPCADITEADFFYNGNPADSATGTRATVNIHLDVASCTRLTYELVVLDSLANQTQVATGSVPGDGVALDEVTGKDVVEVNADVPQSARDGNVCVYATTSDGRREIDRAPDTGCVELIPGGSGGGVGFG
jgi:hypothetical protein